MKARTLTPLVLTAAVLCWALAPWPAPAAPVDPVAKLGDTASMNEDTGTYNLKVDSDGKKIRAADLDIIQGDPDTQYTVDTSVGSGTAQAPKRVATVDKKTGAVLYRVSGTMAGAGGRRPGQGLADRLRLRRQTHGRLRQLLIAGRQLRGPGRGRNGDRDPAVRRR